VGKVRNVQVLTTQVSPDLQVTLVNHD